MFVTGFIGYFTVTAPDVQISPLKRYVYICFVSISIVLTAFDMFSLGWLGLADFGSIYLMNVFLFLLVLTLYLLWAILQEQNYA